MDIYKDFEGKSPFEIAIETKQLDVALALKEQGADLHRTSFDAAVITDLLNTEKAKDKKVSESFSSDSKEKQNLLPDADAPQDTITAVGGDILIEENVQDIADNKDVVGQDDTPGWFGS